MIENIHTMKALSYPAYDCIELSEHPLPAYADHEVLLKVAACGICGSELETFKSKSQRRIPPLIMGHEFCGRIVAKGKNVKGWEPGMMAVSNSIVSCGDCLCCQTGQTNLCINRKVFGMQRNGAFAEYVNVSAACLIPVSPTVMPNAACLSEPLANGVHMVKLTMHIPAKNIVIIGAGSIGLMAQQAFQSMRNVNTIVADIRPERLQVAKRLGAKAVINPSLHDLDKQVKEITGEDSVDIVIDAVGAGHTSEKGLAIVRPGGTLMIIGLQENTRSLFSYDIILSEKKVIGSYAATQEDMQEALALISSGKVDVSSWIHYYGLDNGVQAFNDMMEAKGNHIKSVLVMDNNFNV